MSKLSEIADWFSHELTRGSYCADIEYDIAKIKIQEASERMEKLKEDLAYLERNSNWIEAVEVLSKKSEDTNDEMRYFPVIEKAFKTLSKKLGIEEAT
jgi:hypothetical protein